MILYSIIHLSLIFLYSWINVWSLGYLGIFTLILINLFYCIILILHDLYYIWVYNISIEFTNFLWVSLGNNIFIYWNFNFDLFGSILSFIIISGAFFVIIFVFIDMWDDKEGSNFVINLGFFIIFMLIVTNAGNLMLFYLGWEGIGLTSLFLVNFWSERVRSIKASFKIFFINKIGDVFVMILICLLCNFFGDLDFMVINSLTPLLLNFQFLIGNISINTTELLGVLLLISGSIKSAQYGFHIWLLEAMEAPLGASALMHSSTLVVSGLVLIYRLSIFIELSSLSQILMFLMGSFSATSGSLIACFQYELKVIMAYSTISNMGYMFLLFSIGAYYETILVMILHAYIKIFMFLVVGGIILHCNGCQDVRWMGGLLLYIPSLWVAYTCGGICLIGLPYWSGYYCKYYILSALSNSFVLFKGTEYILLLSYFLTIFYVTRAGYLIFLGPKNGHRKIYRIKPTSLLYIFDLLLLMFIILFSSYFWVNLLYTSKQVIFNNIFIKSFYYFNYVINEISKELLYFWLIIYLLNFAVILFWLLISINFSWNFLKLWNILFFFFSLFFINYTINIIYLLNEGI